MLQSLEKCGDAKLISFLGSEMFKWMRIKLVFAVLQPIKINSAINERHSKNVSSWGDRSNNSNQSQVKLIMIFKWDLLLPGISIVLASRIREIELAVIIKGAGKGKIN